MRINQSLHHRGFASVPAGEFISVETGEFPVLGAEKKVVCVHSVHGDVQYVRDGFDHLWERRFASVIKMPSK